jgi:Flp pilus assembly protein protease CpaA
MATNKHLLQKVSSVSSILFFIASAVFTVLLVAAGKDASQVYKASVGASMFFCFMVGIVLRVMGTADLPKLGFTKDEL